MDSIFKVGQSICQNKYRVEELLGKGTFGEVYRVTHSSLNVSHALKVLRRDSGGIDSSNYERYRDRFQKEASLGAEINHPNLIRVYDFVEEDGMLLLIMEYAPGRSLKDRLETGALSVEETIHMGVNLLDGLEELHSKHNTIHRDLKPSNILFDANGNAKIADLGLAQVSDDLSKRSLLGSMASHHPGTNMYKSPEQERETGLLLPTSDIFGLGCVLFESLTNKCYKEASNYGTSTRSHRSDVPVWLDMVISRALRETPGRVPDDDGDTIKRYRRAKQMKSALLLGYQNKTQTQRLQMPWKWVGLGAAGIGILGLFALMIAAIIILNSALSNPTQQAALDPITTATFTWTPTISPVATATLAPTPLPQPTITKIPTSDVLVLASTLPSRTSTLTPTPTPQPDTATVSVGAYLRSGPSQAYTIIGTLTSGTKLVVLGRNTSNTWLYVRTPTDKEGWISLSVVNYLGEIETLTIMSAPPLPTQPLATDTRGPVDTQVPANTKTPTATEDPYPYP